MCRDQTSLVEDQDISETGEEFHDFLFSDELRWDRRKIGKFHDRIVGQHRQQFMVLRTDSIRLLQLHIDRFRHILGLQIIDKLQLFGAICERHALTKSMPLKKPLQSAEPDQILKQKPARLPAHDM